MKVKTNNNFLYKNKTFSTFEIFEKHLKKYESQEKEKFITRDSVILADEKYRYKYLKLVCKFYGKPRNEKPTISRIEEKNGCIKSIKARKSSSFKKGCEAYITVKFAQDHLFIQDLNLTHNHPETKAEFHKLPENRIKQLSPKTVAEMALLFKTRVQNAYIKKHIADTKNKLLTTKDLNNMKSKLNLNRRKNRCEENNELRPVLETSEDYELKEGQQFFSFSDAYKMVTKFFKSQGKKVKIRDSRPLKFNDDGSNLACSFAALRYQYIIFCCPTVDLNIHKKTSQRPVPQQCKAEIKFTCRTLTSQNKEYVRGEVEKLLIVDKIGSEHDHSYFNEQQLVLKEKEKKILNNRIETDGNKTMSNETRTKIVEELFKNFSEILINKSNAESFADQVKFFTELHDNFKKNPTMRTPEIAAFAANFSKQTTEITNTPTMEYIKKDPLIISCGSVFSISEIVEVKTEDKNLDPLSTRQQQTTEKLEQLPATATSSSNEENLREQSIISGATPKQQSKLVIVPASSSSLSSQLPRRHPICSAESASSFCSSQEPQEASTNSMSKAKFTGVPDTLSPSASFSQSPSESPQENMDISSYLDKKASQFSEHSSIVKTTKILKDGTSCDPNLYDLKNVQLSAKKRGRGRPKGSIGINIIGKKLLKYTPKYSCDLETDQSKPIAFKIRSDKEKISFLLKLYFKDNMMVSDILNKTRKIDVKTVETMEIPDAFCSPDVSIELLKSFFEEEAFKLFKSMVENKIWMCGKCNDEVNDDSVKCDNCQKWYHFKCVIKKEDKFTVTWFCEKCSEK